MAQADILRAMGCDTVQGFVFAAAHVRAGIPGLDRKRAAARAQVGGLSQHLPHNPLVDSGQGADVLDRGAFADLVHGRVGQAEIDHRAKLDEEAPVRRAAAGREFGLRCRSPPRSLRRPRRRAGRAGSGTLRPRSALVTLAPGASRSAISSTSFTRSAPRWRLLKRMLSCAVAEPGITLLALVGVEIAVNSRFDGGNCSVPSSRCSASSAAITRARGGMGLVARCGIGDMALDARHFDPHVDRAAAADLHRVAQPVDRGRLADQDHVGPDVPLVQPVDDPRRSVSRIALLIAGDQQRQGPCLARSATRRRQKRRLRSSCRWRRGPPEGHHRSRAAKGSPLQPSPGGTTSRWPAKPKCGRLARESRPCSRSARRAASPMIQRWTVKPSGVSAAPASRTPRPRAGVTLGQRISSDARQQDRSVQPFLFD